jgi:hypothetical protein
MMEQLIVWTGLDEWRTEVARVNLTEDGVQATGTQIGVDPVPYHLEYDLDAADGFVTRSLRVRCEGAAWARGLDLTRDGGGVWRATYDHEGSTEMPSPSAEVGQLDEALDCDLAFSPMTNLMPIRRHRLNEQPGSAEFMMAWVTVPELTVRASRQRYEHVRVDDHGSVVRFIDLGLFVGFTADLELGSHGLIQVYPELARRVEPSPDG